MSCPVCGKNHKAGSKAKARCEAAVAAKRRRLPNEREGITHRFTIGDLKGYVTAGLYDDGSLGEIFVKLDRQGSAVSGLVDSWAISVSMLLQLGVPLEVITNKFKAMRFEPEGMTSNPEIRIAQSPVDYIVRWMEMRFGAGRKE